MLQRLLRRCARFIETHERTLLLGTAAVVALVAALILVLFLWGDRITMAMWNRFHILPEVVTYFNPDDADLALSIGYYTFNTFGRSGYDLEEAERWLYRALELDPMVATGWHQLARIDFLRGNLGGALVKINRQIELHGDAFMPAYYIRGLVYVFGGQFEKAEVDFEKNQAWNPGSWGSNNDLAFVYFRQGKYEEALATAEHGLTFEHAKDNPWLLTTKGAALLNLGRKEEARESFEEALARAQSLTRDEWIYAYPGNDPAIAGQGIAEVIAAIEANLELVD